MKYSKAEVHCKTHGLPTLRFEDSQLTSFSGLILLQALFARLGLKERLRRCFSHLTVSPIFGRATLVLCLVVHLMLGYRRRQGCSEFVALRWTSPPGPFLTIRVDIYATGG